MDHPLLFGYDLLKFLESIRNPILNHLFYFASLLGNQNFYIVFFPVLFWVISKKYGLRLLTIFLASSYINSLLKLLFESPRPAADKVIELFGSSHGDSFGLPSGHSQNAIALWGMIFLSVKNRWLKGISLALMILIPLSRLYNANHFPADVWAGLAIGVVVLFVFYKWVFAHPDQPNQDSLENRFYHLIFKMDEHSQKITIKIPALLWANLLFFLLLHYAYPHPFLAMIIGVMMGSLLGFALLSKNYSFSVHGLIWHKIGRIVIGLSVMVIIKEGLKWLFKELFGSSIVEAYPEFSLVRYMVIALWAMWLAPEVFVMVGLAKRTSYDELYAVHQERS